VQTPRAEGKRKRRRSDEEDSLFNGNQEEMSRGQKRRDCTFYAEE